MESVRNFGDIAVVADLLAEGACCLFDELSSTQNVIDTDDIFWSVPDFQINSAASWSA